MPTLRQFCDLFGSDLSQALHIIVSCKESRKQVNRSGYLQVGCRIILIRASQNTPLLPLLSFFSNARRPTWSLHQSTWVGQIPENSAKERVCGVCIWFATHHHRRSRCLQPHWGCVRPTGMIAGAEAAADLIFSLSCAAGIIQNRYEKKEWWLNVGR